MRDNSDNRESLKTSLWESLKTSLGTKGEVHRETVGQEREPHLAEGTTEGTMGGPRGIGRDLSSVCVTINERDPFAAKSLEISIFGVEALLAPPLHLEDLNMLSQLGGLLAT